MRYAQITRETRETQIELALSLDGGQSEISTGIGFFDHMLNAFAMHGNFALQLNVNGDLEVDTHHTVEDTGIALGQAFKRALGDMSGINRFGTAFIPMDESLAFCSVDISNRPYLHFDATFDDERCGDFELATTEEFFRAFAVNAGITLHIAVPYGANSHHKAEAMFKALAHALKSAVAPADDDGVLSTKGVL